MLLQEGGLLQRQQRRLAAILAADVAGYSRLMAVDEAGTLARLKQLQAEVIEPAVFQFNGRLVGSAGDLVSGSCSSSPVIRASLTRAGRWT